MAFIANRKNIAKRNMESEAAILSKLYMGGRKENKADVVEIMDADKKTNKAESVVSMGSLRWQDSKGYHTVWNQIKEISQKISDNRKSNVANLPNDYYSLFDLFRIDITRRRLQEVDYTSMISVELVNDAYTESLRLLEFLPFGAPFKEYAGNNDSVNLIEQKTGDDDTVIMKNYAVGWKESLMNAIYNVDLNKMQRVMEAVERGHRGLRNDLSIGQLPAKTTAAGWDSGQQVVADTTGSTYDQKLYNTLNNAIRTLADLYDFQTKQKIDTSQIILAVETGSITRDVNRVINGQLNNSKGLVGNYAALEIDEVWPYRGDTIYYGKEKIVYPGIANLKAYMFVPGPAGAPNWTLTKRSLTQEIGDGSVLQLSQEERAWYFIQSRYWDEWFGTSSGNTKIAADTSGNIFGYVVEISLPSP